MNTAKAPGEDRSLAAKLAAAVGRLALRAVDGLCRHLPEGKSTPW